MIGKVFTDTPVTKIEIITSSKLIAKERNIPDTIAGASIGNVTVKNAFIRDAPRSRAASIANLSITDSRAFT